MDKVIIMSRREAETIDLGGNTVVSITDPRVGPANLRNAGWTLRVAFNDYVSVEMLPIEPIRKIFKFLNEYSHSNQLIVHCEAGVSRSAGVALFCTETYGAEVDLRHKSPNLALVKILRDVRDYERMRPGEPE